MSMKESIVSLLVEHPEGLTDAEMEQMLRATHQMVSSKRRKLVLDGRVRSTGTKRNGGWIWERGEAPAAERAPSYYISWPQRYADLRAYEESGAALKFPSMPLSQRLRDASYEIVPKHTSVFVQRAKLIDVAALCMMAVDALDRGQEANKRARALREGLEATG